MPNNSCKAIHLHTQIINFIKFRILPILNIKNIDLKSKLLTSPSLYHGIAINLT